MTVEAQAGVDFESELRLSPRFVIIALLVLGVLLVLTTPLWGDADRQLEVMILALLIYLSIPLGWLLIAHRPHAGRWFSILIVVALTWLASTWFRVPGALTLLALPPALAATIATPRVGILVALVESVGMVPLAIADPQALSASILVAPLPWGEVAVAMAVIWALQGFIHAIYQPTHRVARWSQAYYQRARGLVQEARDRRADLEQALDDVAHTNRQLALANERLAALRMIAEEAQKTKTAFVAKVSHEFRTPLNMIIGLVDLLIETPDVYGEHLPSNLMEDLEIVHRNCQHLSSMINDVLDLSRAEAGGLAVHKERVDLKEVINDALLVIQPLMEKKSLSLETEIGSDVDAIFCDRTRIRQVILNLVSNAARFTEHGGITVRAKRREQSVLVSVQDTGPGIAPEDAERIFEPFCQGQNKLWRDREGSGLGLSISKQFIELHGGRIWLESELGAGTTFYFDLPLSLRDTRPARPDRWIKEEWIWMEDKVKASRPELPQQTRVVISDRTGTLHSALDRHAEQIELVDTRSWPQTLHELREYPAHAVIINATSPEDLWETLDAARSAVPDTPIIGCHVPPRITHALEAGASNYLVKPVTHGQLAEMLEGIERPPENVLVVDDDPDVVRLLTRMLLVINSDLQIETASRGSEALAKLRDNQPDLMLLDVMMPDMDGWTVLELKERDARIADVPVVFVSARDPEKQPMASEVLLATIGSGLSLNKLLRCSVGLSTLLLHPE
jgi:signal transduction histidine kinase/CheY-like chemotaxis protein